jgi:hypothetical protein
VRGTGLMRALNVGLLVFIVAAIAYAVVLGLLSQ